MSKSNVLRLVLAVVACALVAQAAGDSGMEVLKKFQVGGEGGWDYIVVDAEARRVYVSHATHVVVLDADTGAQLADIPDTPGVHGIAIVKDAGKGYITAGRDNSAVVFDLKTLKPTGKVAIGQNPDALLYDPASKHVFIFNGRSHDASVIDARTDTVVATIPLGGKPEAGASDGAGMVYVNIEDKHSIAVIDTKNNTVTATWVMEGCEDPTGLSLDKKNSRLFAACGNKVLAVVDAANGKVITTVPTGAGSDGDAFDADRGLIYTSNGEGTLSVIRQDSKDKYTLVENVSTQRSARTIALDTKTHNVLLPAAEFGQPAAPGKRGPMVPDSFIVLVVGRK